MTRVFDADLIVIGAGSGGVRAARMAAAAGKRVIVAERARVGGTCVNVGCIPKKLFHYAAQYREHFADCAGFGWAAEPPTFAWPTLQQNKDVEIARLNTIYRNILANSGVQLVEGEGVIRGAHTVSIGEQLYTAQHLLIATGGVPWKPAIPGAELALTSDEFFALPELPASALVVGGGYIAVELASILGALGCQVTLVHRGERLLRHFDHEVSGFLATEMRKKHIDVMFHENVSQIERRGSQLAVMMTSGAEHMTDCVLLATGRKPALDGLGLENTAVQRNEAGYVIVDGNLCTDEPSIYALGDVVGRKELTPVATAEAMWLVDHLYGTGKRQLPVYNLVPSAVFSTPELGCVGLTQEESVARYGADVQIYRSEFRALKHTLSGSNERTLMKIVVQPSTDRVLGMHMVGDSAGEIMQGFAAALQCGITKTQIDRTIGIHPTAAEEFVTMRSPVA